MNICCLIHGKMRSAHGVDPKETASSTAPTCVPWLTSCMERRPMGRYASCGSAAQAAAIPMPSSLTLSSLTLHTAFSSSCGRWRNTSSICIPCRISVPVSASPCPYCTVGKAFSWHISRNGWAYWTRRKPLRSRS